MHGRIKLEFKCEDLYLPKKKSDSTILKIKNKQGVITKTSDKIAAMIFWIDRKKLSRKNKHQSSNDRNLPPITEALTNIDKTTVEKVKK